MPRRATPLTPQVIIERNRMVEENIKLVNFVARRLRTIRRLRFAHEDLLQEGYLALIQRATYWLRNPGEGCRFSTNTVKEIRKQMKSHARRLACPFKLNGHAVDQVERLERGNPLTQPHHLVQRAKEALEREFKFIHPRAYGDTGTDIPIEPTDHHRFDDLYAAMRRLSKDERELIEDLYGLSRPPILSQEAANRRGITAARISQRRIAILDKLRRIMEGKPERDFFPRGPSRPGAEARSASDAEGEGRRSPMRNPRNDTPRGPRRLGNE
jgi:RNA polymerase sigma factor (sigma-70 family)